MADQTAEKVEAPAPAAGAQDTPAGNVKDSAPVDKQEDEAVKAADEDAKSDTKPDSGDASAKTEVEGEKPEGDVEMKDAPANPAAEVATPSAKDSSSRRKSGAGDSKAKTLNRKNSKARLTNIHAKPGDHFLVKLKGFPAWPAIICDEDMLPEALVTTRPVTAARPDGTYAEAYADGGKRANDRTFPVMYLYTNEFGWVANTALTELSAEKAKDSITDKMRKDLKAAFELAAEANPIETYKEVLEQAMAEVEEAQRAKAEAAATPKKSKKKAKGGDEEDEDMGDVDEGTKFAKSKKRKAEDDTSTPQRSDSIKKPKIKLTTSSTPKAANGTAKGKEDSAAKPKTKAKKPKEEKKAENAKEVKLSPEERLKRKEKEVLYLRHKLQRGLLTRDQQPQESEMKQMSEFITMLENFVDLEVAIIRTTKINKVLKAILKLDSIPREEEFQFKKRSQTLLDKWNKLLAVDGTSANGVNGAAEADAPEKKEANGVKEDAGEAKSSAPPVSAKASPEQAGAEKDSGAKEASEPAAKETETTAA